MYYCPYYRYFRPMYVPNPIETPNALCVMFLAVPGSRLGLGDALDWAHAYANIERFSLTALKPIRCLDRWEGWWVFLECQRAPFWTPSLNTL